MPHFCRRYRGYSKLLLLAIEKITTETYNDLHIAVKIANIHEKSTAHISPSDKLAADRKNHTTIDCGNIQNDR
jgi:hypothetical protein